MIAKIKMHMPVQPGITTDSIRRLINSALQRELTAHPEAVKSILAPGCMAVFRKITIADDPK